MRAQLVLIAIVLCIHLHDAATSITCDSITSSHLTSQTSNDYWFNISSSSTIHNNDWDTLDIEVIAQPFIPIEIYFTNATLYTSCYKSCTLRHTPLTQSYILRVNRYLRAQQAMNYTLSVICRPSSIDTTIYTTDTVLIETEFVYSVGFSQRLNFRNRGNILSFGGTVLIVLTFISIGLYMHYDSSNAALKFLARKSNAPFYLCGILTLIVSIIMCGSEFNTNEYWLGILIALTMSCINAVSVIGLKYYASYIRNIHIKQCKITLAKLGRFISLFLGIFYLIFYYIFIINVGASLLSTVLIITYIELAWITIVSFASKTAQIQWCILFLLIGWLHDSTIEEIFFDFYWYSIFCIACALCSIFLFSTKEYAGALRGMFLNVFGCFLSIFDIATDLTVMIVWISGGLYFWTVMQVVFISFATIYSAFYIDDYYFIDAASSSYSLSPSSQQTHTDKKERHKRLIYGRLFTLFGFGRVYHGILGWDDGRHKDMEISNRILKVWEMIFESFPTICLQTWISLYTDLDVNIVLSLGVGLASISFSFFRVLYGDHNSKTREEEYTIAYAINEKYRVYGTLTNCKAEDAGSRQVSARSPNTLKVATPTNDAIGKTATSIVDKTQTVSSLWRHFICCYPIKMCCDRIRYKQDKVPGDTKSKSRFTGSERFIYFILYLWVMTDFGIRIFPILACARLRQQYLEFLLVMLILTLFEFGGYYHMLSGDFKTPRSASHFFWTLYFTISYCLLSSMHVIYLPNNVVFDKLISEHSIRMFIQAGFMVAAMLLQLYEFGDVFGFFEKTIMVFWGAWILNWVLTFAAKRGFYMLEDKIKVPFMNTENQKNSDVNHADANAMELHLIQQGTVVTVQT